MAVGAPADGPKPLRVLLAEDNKVNQKFARLLLSRDGHHVDIAEDGYEAVEAIQRAEYDLVLMDVQMPRLDGVQATIRIRALPPPKCSVPIIAVTAVSGVRDQLIEAGMDDYVSKPIDSALLLAKLAEIAQKVGRSPRASDSPAPEEDRRGDDLAALLAHSAVDKACLDTIRSVMTKEEADEFVRNYLDDASERVARMSRSLADGDLAAMGADGHALIGTAGNVGANLVSEIARSVEDACKAGDHASASLRLRQLQAAIDPSSAALRLWLTSG